MKVRLRTPISEINQGALMKRLKMILAMLATTFFTQTAFGSGAGGFCEIVTKNNKPSTPMTAQLLADMKNECNRLTDVHESVKSATYPGCDSHKSPRECYKYFLGKNPPRTAMVSTLMAVVGVAAVLREGTGSEKKVCGNRICDFGVADVSLRTLESTNFSNFVVNRANPVTAEDKEYYQAVLRKETLSFVSGQSEVLKIVNKSLASIYAQLPKCSKINCTAEQMADVKDYENLLNRYNSFSKNRTVAGIK